jgi:TolA-binding protein
MKPLALSLLGVFLLVSTQRGLPPKEGRVPSVLAQNPSPKTLRLRQRTARELLELGRSHLEAGELAKALEKLKLALERSPRGALADEALLYMGRAELGLGRPWLALKSLKPLVARPKDNPFRPEALYLAGEAYLRLMDKVQALRHWKELEARYPGHRLAPKARRAIEQMASRR